MNDIQVRPKEDVVVWEVVEEQPQQLTQVNHYYVQLPETNWLTVVGSLNPVTQIVGMVSLLALGFFSLNFITAAIAGLATFALAVLNMSFIAVVAIALLIFGVLIVSMLIGVFNG